MIPQKFSLAIPYTAIFIFAVLFFVKEAVGFCIVTLPGDKVFMICQMGQKTMENTRRIRNYLRSIEKNSPGAIVILAVSTYTIVSPDLFNYNLTVRIQRFGNGEKKSGRFYYTGNRWCYYKEFILEHKEIKYMIVSDDDTLFFKDPFSLIDDRKDVIHIMYDPVSYANKSDCNFIWAKAWANGLRKESKEKCGIWDYDGSLDTPELRKTLFYNDGLLLGTTEALLNISELMCHSYNCPGDFPNNADQGLMNYLLLTKQFDTLNLKLIGYNIDSNVFISCPEYLNSDELNEATASNSLVAVHHYEKLNSRKDSLPKNLKELMY